MYEEIYMIEKTMQYREQEFRKVEFTQRDAEHAKKELFYCKLPVLNQMSICNCN
ncbi:hypothetical protein [Neobacillus piezotolerans]|uniref:hypothetical protein n=1 Tax=Neobacillus piezotolerans TaxID=2259171 RepID=UPI0015F12C45|nr:hypothetical protein [Neobacillus piezotolerans]